MADRTGKLAGSVTFSVLLLLTYHSHSGKEGDVISLSTSDGTFLERRSIDHLQIESCKLGCSHNQI